MKTQVQQSTAAAPLSSVMGLQWAVLLSDDGREVLITEDMIQKACAELARRCHKPLARAA